MLIILIREIVHICPFRVSLLLKICMFFCRKLKSQLYFLCFFSFTKVFHEVAYKARNRGDLLAGIDEFLDKVTVLPPGEWDPQIRLAPPEKVPSQNDRRIATDPKKEQTCKKVERNSRQPPVKWFKR